MVDLQNGIYERAHEVCFPKDEKETHHLANFWDTLKHNFKYVTKKCSQTDSQTLTVVICNSNHTILHLHCSERHVDIV